MFLHVPVKFGFYRTKSSLYRTHKVSQTECQSWLWPLRRETKFVVLSWTAIVWCLEVNGQNCSLYRSRKVSEIECLSWPCHYISVGIGAFVIGLGQISSFLSFDPKSNGYLLPPWSIYVWNLKVHKITVVYGFTECQSWSWPCDPKSIGLFYLTMNTLHVKFRTDRALSVFCIMSTRFHRHGVKVDPALWSCDQKSIWFLISLWITHSIIESDNSEAIGQNLYLYCIYKVSQTVPKLTLTYNSDT